MKSVWMSIDCEVCKKQVLAFEFTGMIPLSVSETVANHVKVVHRA